MLSTIGIRVEPNRTLSEITVSWESVSQFLPHRVNCFGIQSVAMLQVVLSGCRYPKRV